MERERKRLVAQGRAKAEDMLRNIKLPCWPEHENMEALAAGISIARCSTGVAIVDDKMLSAKGIIGYMVSKLGKETESRRFLYLREALGREEQKVFRKWLAIEERAAEIFRHQKMAAAWFREGNRCPTEVAARPQGRRKFKVRRK